VSLPSKSKRVSSFRDRLLVFLILGLLITAAVSSVLLNRNAQAAAFASGNLVIYRVGDGASALSNLATAVFLDEYATTGGAAVQSIAMPTVVNGSNKRLTASGTATSEGLLTLSTDGNYITATGYDAALGTASITTSTSASVNRVIARVDGTGTVNTTTALSDASTGSNPRSSVSTNGTDIWMDGGAGGIRYTTLGSTTSTQLSTTVTNLRQTNIFAGQLYVSSASGAFRLASVGTGTPTTSGQTITNLPGFPTATGSPYGFFFADLDAGVSGVDTVYVADDGGTIQKYSLVAGTWTANGTKALSSVRGITGVVSGASVTLYVTNGSSLQTITDTSGYNATITGTLTSLATAPANTAFRGVAFAPAGGSPTPSPSPTPTPTPALSINDVSQVEGNSGTSSFTFTVSLSQPAPIGGVTFDVDTADGTATTLDSDYAAVHTTGVTIAEGASSTNVVVLVNGDATPEANETFFVNISNVTNAGVTDAQGKGTINNDDGVGASTVVISQVYGGGGNSGATYRNDFIELYNRGTTPVDVTGWSVQFALVTDSFGAVSPTNLSGIIQPGHYYLIQEAAGANVTTSVLLPTPDATGSIAVGSQAGKVALVSNTTVLSGTCPGFLANGIVDFVGYGAANCSETSPVGGTSNLTAAIRNNNGCTDTDNNNADFSVSSGPIPRNSSITNTCAGSGNLSASGSANPNSVDPGGTTLLTVTVSPASGPPPSTGITVTGNLTNIGGPAVQTFYDDGTHGDVTVGDNIFSFTAITAPASTAGAKSLPISIADGQARGASAFITMSILNPTCGVERWSIKVGTDAEANQVNLNSTTPITISDMRGWAAPSPTPPTSRVAPYEKTAWVINGTLNNYKKEDDVDYHLVVQDGSGTNTVITEIPCPCCAIGSPFEPRMDVARSTFDNKLTATTFFQNPNIPVRITGVGFFDFIHGQTGVAPNGIELHTILDISFPTQQTGTTSNGSNVSNTIGDATIRFTSVTNPGLTTVTPIDPASAGTPPGSGGYKVVGPAFDISTAATTTGPYNVCISVPYITDSDAFLHLKLLHNEGGNLIDRTTGQNFASKLICGNSPTLSPFAVALASAPTAADSVIAGQITTSTGAPVAGAVVSLSGMQNRKTITDANGNYQFNNVETNGFYIVTPSRANFLFSPGQRSFSQLGNKTEAAFTGSISLQGANPLDTAEYFVRQHYLDFLGREPDESGFNFWSNEIIGCGDDFDCVDQKRMNVSAAYFLSIEFQATGGLVDGLYRASFDRAPNYAEFTPDSVNIAKDVVVGRAGWQQQLAANKQSFLDAFVQRPDFQNAYAKLSNSQYVDQLLAHTRVSWTQGERNALVDSLTNGSQTRANVLGLIAGDERFVAAKQNEMFVMMEYFGYLRRDPDAAGYQYWLNKLNQFNGNFERAEMVRAFIVSSEYRERFPR
jgi:hypothetical protein